MAIKVFFSVQKHILLTSYASDSLFWYPIRQAVTIVSTIHMVDKLLRMTAENMRYVNIIYGITFIFMSQIFNL